MYDHDRCATLRGHRNAREGLPQMRRGHVRPLEYAATFEPGEQLPYLEGHLPKTIAKYRSAIDFAVKNLAPLGVKQLEPLATALYYTASQPHESQKRRAERILEVKSHIRMEDAMLAVTQVDRWREENIHA